MAGKKSGSTKAKSAKKTNKKAKTGPEAQRDELLLATLPYVEAEGFGREALLLGAADIGMNEDEALELFPGGGVDMVLHFNDWAVREMLRHCAPSALERMRVRDRIRLLVRTYLDVLTDYKPAVKQAVVLARPWNMGDGAKQMYHVVDAMWLAAGDTATDYNFYTKRALLAGVLGSTTLRWLIDTSENHADTWDFLDSRIDNVMQIEKLKAGILSRFAA